jgi:hypothetical protein
MLNNNSIDELSQSIDSVYNNGLNLMQNKSIEIAKDYTIEKMVDSHLILFNKLN